MLDDPTKKHQIYGSFLAILSMIFFVLDLICLVALLDKQLRNFNGIRIMIAISLCDVLNLIPVGMLPGIMAFTGHIYCSNVTLSYFQGQSALTLYVLTTSYTVILSINRCLAVAYPKIEAKLFDGFKVFIWIGAIFSYGLYFYFTTTTIFYTSWAAHFLYDPYFGYAIKDDGVNENVWHYYSNLLTAFFVLFTYLAFAAFYLNHRNNSGGVSFNGNTADRTKSIFASVFINASILCFSNIIYIIIQSIKVNDLYYRVSLTAAICVQGMNAILYYILNPTIRKIVQHFRIFNFINSTKPSQISILQTNHTKI